MLASIPHRARVALLCVAVVLASVPAIGSTFATSGTETITQITQPSWKCPDAGYAVELKRDEGPPAGVSTFSSGDFSVVIDNVVTADGQVLSWSASHPVDAVYAKGAAGGYLHEYSPAATSDTGLHTLANNPVDKPLHWADFSHLSFCFKTQPTGTTTSSTSTTAAPTTTTTVAPLRPLDVALDAAGSYTQTFEWAIAKAADRTWIARSGSSAPLTYTIGVTRTGYVLSDETLTGTVRIDNPNPAPVAVTSLDVPGCAIAAPTNVTSGTTTVGFSCDVSAAVLVSGLPTSLGATIGWDDPHPTPVAESDTATGAVAWTPTQVDASVSVVDAVDGGTARPLGTLTDSGPIADAVTVPTPATAGCRTVSNTATIVETGQSASASVTVCRQALTVGGHTIGFWQNKNGQAVIGGNTPVLCSALASYSTVFAGTGFPTSCTATTLTTWVTSVIKNANSKDAVLMFRAQFLGTALGALTVGVPTHLGETDAPVTGALVGTSASCLTISQLLSAANASYTTLAANRTGMLTVKDWFDKINNNVMPVCA